MAANSDNYDDISIRLTEVRLTKAVEFDAEAKELAATVLAWIGSGGFL